MTTPLRLLVVEDSELDAQLLVRELERGGYDPRWQRVETPESLQQALDAQIWDVIICDYTMPRLDAPHALKVVQARGDDVPFIVVSGKIGEDTAVEVIRSGASDYVMKDNLSRLTVAIEREVAEAKARRERQQVEQALRDEVAGERQREVRVQQARARLLFFAVSNSLDDLLEETLNEMEAITGSVIGFYHFVDADQEGLTLQNWSTRTKREFCNAQGKGSHYPMAEAGVWVDCVRERKPVIHNDYASLPHKKGMPPGHAKVVRELVVPVLRQDRIVAILGVGNKPTDYDERDARTVALFADLVWDIAERKRAEAEHARLEDELRASQKMEAIGRLAGGVAHDFNNMLSVILTYTGFAMDGAQESAQLKADLSEVKKAAERAVTLTRQLLAFSRKQVLRPVPLDLNQITLGVEKMLRRLISEDVELVLDLVPELGIVRADPGQMEQVLLNLVLNARDAMPKGGKLTLATANVMLDDAYAASHIGTLAGSYVRLTVADTGCGMDERTRARLFEPFFTTKEMGKGTGLGLSTVYGIIKQSGGEIHVASAPGRGTRFDVYLPHDRSATTAATVTSASVPRPATGRATILVVEDEEALRNVARRILEGAGYHVLTAADGKHALRVCEQHAGVIHLVLTDVVMPEMGGKALADRLVGRFPAIKILFMSGYSDEAIARHGVLEPGTHLISKPFDAGALTAKVREVLDS